MCSRNPDSRRIQTKRLGVLQMILRYNHVLIRSNLRANERATPCFPSMLNLLSEHKRKELPVYMQASNMFQVHPFVSYSGHRDVLVSSYRQEPREIFHSSSGLCHYLPDHVLMEAKKQKWSLPRSKKLHSHSPRCAQPP